MESPPIGDQPIPDPDTPILVIPAKAAFRNRTLRKGRLFVVLVSGGYAKRPDVIDLGYDAGLGIQDLAEVYRAVERLGVCFETAAYIGRF